MAPVEGPGHTVRETEIRERGIRGLRGGVRRALLAACASAALACAPLNPPPQVPRYFAANPELVLEAAAEVLSREGYVLAKGDPTYGMVTGEQQKTLTRVQDGILAVTQLITQIVVEASASGDGTQVLTTFSIRSRRSSGESRTWVSESPLGERYRQRFYVELVRELGLDAADGADAQASH